MAREGYAGSTDWGQLVWGLHQMTKQELAAYHKELCGDDPMKGLTKERLINVIGRMLEHQYDLHGNKIS